MKELKSHFHIHRFLQEDPRPAVILYVGGNHPQSDQMLLILDALRKRYDGQVRCGFANVSRLIAARRALKIDAIPLVWLVENGKIVEVLKGVDAKLLSSKVAALLDGQLGKASSETAPDGQLGKASSETAAAAEQYDVDAMLKEATELAKQRVKQMIQDELLLLVGPGTTVEDDAKKLREEHDLDRLNVVITIGTGLVEVDEEIGEAFCEEYGGWHEESYIFIEGDKVDRDELFGTQFQTTYLPRLKAANEKMTQRLNSKIQALINQAPIMLFMKGTKERPFCKFSKEIVRILNEAGVEYDYFNIFTDDAIREGLKKYSRWPTYPQLYVKGELVGGLDIIKQMIQDMNGVAGLKDALLQIPV